MIRRLIPVLCIAAGIFMMLDQGDADAAPAPDALGYACNRRVAAFPSKYFNPDAGTGALMGCANKNFNTLNLENETTTPVYVCWRDGTRAGAADAGYANLGLGNLSEVCAKRCVGCNNGSSYQAAVNSAQGNLFVLIQSTNDAGLAQLIATDGGTQVRVEYGR